MSERSGIGGVRVEVDDEVPEDDGGFPVTAVTAPPDRLTRTFNEGEPTTGDEEDDEGRAAAARAPLTLVAGTHPLRARRSSSERDMPGRTERFFDRERFGAIAINDSSVPQALTWPELAVVWCGVNPGKAEA